MNLPLSLRLALRELTGGSLAIVLLSLFVAVVATTATYATGARLGSAVLGQAGEFLAADLVYEGPDRPPETWAVRAERLGLRHAATVEFPSMAYVGDDVEMLVSAKAVSSSYPLRGQLQAARTATAIESAASSGVELSPQAPPASGEIWLDERLFQALGLGVGDTMGLADADFMAARILVREPDRASSFGALVPRALMSMDDLQATGAVLPGSRVQWRFLLAGNAEALQSFQDSVPEAEERGYRAISPSSREGSSGEAIRETLSYIRLAGTMVLLLALLAGTLAGHRYFAGQRAQVALLKTLGIPGRRLSFLYLAMLCWGCALAVLVGVALGWALQQWFGYFLETEFGTPTDAPPVAVFVLSAAAALAGFAAALAPALLAAARTAPMRLLRTTDEGRVGWSGVLLPAVVMGAVLFGAAGWRQGLLLLALLAVLAAAAAVLAWLLARLPRQPLGGNGAGANLPLNLARGNWRRRRRANTLQIFVLAAVFFPCASMYGLRANLFEGWERILEQELPNYFVNNISESNLHSLRDGLRELGAEVGVFSPLVRGRWLRAERAAADGPVELDRSVNLSWAEALPDNNELVAGSWWEELDDSADLPGISLEEDYADNLGVAVGDSVTALIGGEERTFRVASLRKVNWFSMAPNFFVLVKPESLTAPSATWVGSFRMEDGDNSALSALLRRHPTVNLFAIDALLDEARTIIGRLISAINLLLVLLLATATLVLAETLLFDLGERRRQSALMRVIGAGGGTLGLALALELAVMGALSGLFGAFAADLLLGLNTNDTFSLGLQGILWLLVVAVAVAALLVPAFFLLRAILRTPPSQILRGEFNE